MAKESIRRLIFCAYAENSDFKSGENIRESKKRGDIYWKNAVVALCSAKCKEPDCDVALFTNADVPAEYSTVFATNEIKVFNEAFDEFLFDKDMTWGLAFYKLCALKKALKKGYDYLCLLDLDTYTQSDFDDMWDECRHYIMLHDRHPRLRVAHRMYAEIAEFTGTERPFTLGGGELIAGNAADLNIFMDEMVAIYKQMISTSFRTMHGDEFIISVAADKFKTKIKNADGYISRYWTGTFRGMNTSYKNDPVSILHCPAEKKEGMISLYRYFVKHQEFPDNRRVHRMLHLEKPSFLTRIKLIGKAVFKIFRIRY